MGRDGADGRGVARAEDPDPQTVGRYVGETQNTLVADVRGLGNLGPLAVDPGVEGVLFDPFALCGDRFLDGQSVEGDRFGGGDDDFGCGAFEQQVFYLDS